jgi:hypothetical protein
MTGVLRALQKQDPPIPPFKNHPHNCNNFTHLILPPFGYFNATFALAKLQLSASEDSTSKVEFEQGACRKKKLEEESSS